jgi:hypothetical protein
MTEQTTTDLSLAKARELTNRIRKQAVRTRDALVALYRLVDEAKQGNAHKALGYASWTAYLSENLGGEAELDLPESDRRALVRYLAGQGMSSYAIAKATGVSQSTASREARKAAKSGEIIRTTVTTTDGKTRKASQPKATSAAHKATGPRIANATRPADPVQVAATLVSQVDQSAARWLDDMLKASKGADAAKRAATLKAATKAVDDAIARLQETKRGLALMANQTAKATKAA